MLRIQLFFLVSQKECKGKIISFIYLLIFFNFLRDLC